MPVRDHQSGRAAGPLFGATAMRATDTSGQLDLFGGRDASGAVSPPIEAGPDLRRGDVDSTIGRSTPATTTMPGRRISTTATRTTTTRTTSSGPEPSADGSASHHHADFSFAELVAAYFDCRRTKRNSANALAFEQDLERNLTELFEELAARSYKPGRAICFVITRPKPREVWAAQSRDRVVHHLLYNRIAARFENAFIADSCACIPGRGTLYAARRLEAKIRSHTENWSRHAFYLKCDLANFFVSIDKRILSVQLAARVTEPFWSWLTDVVLFHDPRVDVRMHATPALLALVPAHKRLANQPAHLGLPIGNLSSQFFANVYLDALDQHVKHRLRARHYVRYVDDFILLHDSPQWLNGALSDIREFLPRELGVRLNESKTVLQPIDRGVDFVGHVIKPWRRSIRLRTVRSAFNRLAGMAQEHVYESANSYFGMLRQAPASHHERAQFANLLRRRGQVVDRAFTKTFRRIA